MNSLPMKSLISLLIALAFTFSLSAQTELLGTWSGKAVKNGQPMGFTLKILKNGSFLMAYDLNPNDLNIRGTWTLNKGTLSFKNSEGILRYKGLTNELSSGKKNKLIFKSGKRSKTFEYIQGPIVLMGWDEGVAAVVVNHEEQY